MRRPESTHELLDRSEAGAPNGVQAARALFLGFDEPGTIEHGQMLRDGLLRNIDRGGYLAHGARTFAEELQDDDSARLAERLESKSRVGARSFHK